MSTSLAPPHPMSSPDPSAQPDGGRLLFCPFCRECFEGEETCPSHELALVDFQDLPKQAHEHEMPGWDEDVDPWDVRFGRGWLALGAVLLVVGFFLPLASGLVEDTAVSWTGYQVATGPAGNLWTVPFVAAMFVYFLLKRRTPVKMMGSRLVAVVLSIAPALSLGYSILNVQRGVARMHGALALEWGAGVYVIAVACVLLLVGSFRFGVLPAGYVAAHADEPHGAAPDERPGRGIKKD